MYREPKTINWVSFRIALVAAVFAVGTVILMARAYQLQVADSDRLKARADRQRNRVLQLEARRGVILDRSGDRLADSLEVHSIFARPRKVEDKRQTAGILSEILGTDADGLLKRFKEGKTFVWIRRRVSPLVAEKIKQADLPGIFSVREYRRYYPLKGLAAHAIGFAGIDSKGLEGLELFYDRDLKTNPIPVTAQRDARGRPIMFASMVQGPKRRDLHLTLDRNIQYTTERELDEAVRKQRARAGAAVVMDADSGEVLALAVAPSYNLNVFDKVSAKVRRNRTIADTFEPGSTFKVFLAAAAMDLGKVKPYDSFFCHKGLFRYKGSKIHDIVPHKWLTLEQILVHSSNIGAVQVSEKLGKSEFYRVLQGFGFGHSTGVDLPGERSGFLPPPGKWSSLSKANIAFGQGLAVNALQMTAAFAAAVNGGKLYRPHLMKRMTNALDETIREYRPVVVRTVIKQSTSDRVVRILRNVVKSGTGKAAAIPGVDIVGKTGTAQKADSSGGYSKDRYVASFVGALMQARPRLVIFVMLDEPSGKYKTGGKIAAPVFRRIAEGILALCGSSPHPNLTVASTERSPKTERRSKRKPRRIKKGSRPGEWVVPNLHGMTMRAVLDICGRMKCDVMFQGTGRAVDQSPKPGKLLKEGAPMTVFFQGEKS
jgi:cell division protein FtsI (penicillin-binding protein 3)